MLLSFVLPTCCILHLLRTIVFVLSVLIHIPYLLVFSSNFCDCVCNLLSVFSNRSMSSANFRLDMFLPWAITSSLPFPDYHPLFFPDIIQMLTARWASLLVCYLCQTSVNKFDYNYNLFCLRVPCTLAYIYASATVCGVFASEGQATGAWLVVLRCLVVITLLLTAHYSQVVHCVRCVGNSISWIKGYVVNRMRLTNSRFQQTERRYSASDAALTCVCACVCVCVSRLVSRHIK